MGCGGATLMFFFSCRRLNNTRTSCIQTVKKKKKSLLNDGAVNLQDSLISFFKEKLAWISPREKRTGADCKRRDLGYLSKRRLGKSHHLPLSGTTAC